jgi:acyl-coenzyme A synthetase/AMP-(fatty) acid ligase
VLFLKGRSDDVMNFDGILVGPAEIESILALHPAVAEAAAFPLPSPRHQDVPAVAVVLKLPLPMDELSRYCVEHLGIRAPRAYFRIDEIPRNDMGKVLRRRLTELALAQLSAGAKPG